MWSAAIAQEPSCVSITSYNEWGEGTQIEATETSLEMYLRYPEDDPYFYLNMTRLFAKELRELHRSAEFSPGVERHDEL